MLAAFIVGVAAAAHDGTSPDDWLLLPAASMPTPTLVEGSLHGVSTLTLSNGLISRVFSLDPAFATVALSRSGLAGREHDTGAQLLRATAPEAVVTLDGTAYPVGGLDGQTDFAFLNTSLLPSFSALPNAFRYQRHRQSVPPARYKWTPGQRSSDATLAWPPKGLHRQTGLRTF